MPAWLLPAAIGAGVGGALGLVGKGSKGKVENAELKTPGQQALLNSALGQLLGYSPEQQEYFTTKRPGGLFDVLFNMKSDVASQPQRNVLPNIQADPLFSKSTSFLSQLLDPSSEASQAYQQQGLKQFQEQILPSIANQYMTGGDKYSSGFRNAALQAGSDLAEKLNAQRLGFQLEGANQGIAASQIPSNQQFNLLSMLLGQNTTAPLYNPGSTGVLQGALQGITGGIGKGVGKGIGGGLQSKVSEWF